MKKEKVYSMNDKKATSGGLGLGTVLFLIFLTLKLAGVGPVAKWSWWWVTSPLWIPFAIVGIIAAIVVGIGVIAYKLKK
jgi:hypothetical protein